MAEDTDNAVTFDERRVARLEGLPAIYKTAHERLAVELALQMEEPMETFKRHGLTPEQGAALLQSPGFAKILERMVTEVREQGLSFRMKARAIAEDLLPEAHDMATDPLVSSAVRLDAIKWTAKIADLEPRTKDEGARGGGGGLTLSITFTGQAPEKVVLGEHEVLEGQRVIKEAA